MKRNIIIYDMEVFRYDCLFGAIIIGAEETNIIQTWNLEEAKKFYEENRQSIWIGHNISRYDNLILQGIVKGKTVPQIKKISDEIIKQERKPYLNIQLLYYDINTIHFIGVKTLEAYFGKNISISEVDFEIDRPLTPAERIKVEKYNIDDLDQTYDDFIAISGEFQLRLNIIEEFKLPISMISSTGTQIAEAALKAEWTQGIEKWVVKPIDYSFLKVKNEEVRDYYLNEKYRSEYRERVKKESAGKDIGALDFVVCDVEHRLASGGLHGARSNFHCDWALYFDVSGYYNLIMIILDLLPRSIPKESKDLYEYMYHEQLKLKKTNPEKRWVYKVILLSVFGAMTNEWCKFYDPYHGELVTICGQIFLIDLLEKLEGKVILIQSNTDGIIAKPIDGISEADIKAIIDEWQKRTGFSLSFDKIYNIHQRDVNCYFFEDAKGEYHLKGDACKHYNYWQNPFKSSSYRMKEEPIITHMLVDYWMKGLLPEEVVEQNKSNLRMFQRVCKLNTFDYMDYHLTNLRTGEVTIERLQSTNRAFAMKADDFNGTIIKKKASKTSKIANLPESVFVHDDEILSEKAIQELMPRIDYQYYIDRGYEAILTFKDFPIIKKVLK